MLRSYQPFASNKLQQCSFRYAAVLTNVLEDIRVCAFRQRSKKLELDRASLRLHDAKMDNVKLVLRELTSVFLLCVGPAVAEPLPCFVMERAQYACLKNDGIIQEVREQNSLTANAERQDVFVQFGRSCDELSHDLPMKELRGEGPDLSDIEKAGNTRRLSGFVFIQYYQTDCFFSFEPEIDDQYIEFCPSTCSMRGFESLDE